MRYERCVVFSNGGGLEEGGERGGGCGAVHF